MYIYPMKSKSPISLYVNSDESEPKPLVKVFSSYYYLNQSLIKYHQEKLKLLYHNLQTPVALNPPV